MTDIMNIWLGNRQSGKTSTLVRKIYENEKKDPNAIHIVVCMRGTESYFKTLMGSRMLHNDSKKFVWLSENSLELGPSFRGMSDLYLYLDDFDQYNLPYYFFSSLGYYDLKEINIATTPNRLREDRELNPAHNNHGDPLIEALQIADFDFEFLFNQKMAEYYLAPANRQVFKEEVILCEGLGLMTK